MQIRTIQKDSKHSNANFNHLNQIRSIRMQILSLRARFKESPYTGGWRENLTNVRQRISALTQNYHNPLVAQHGGKQGF